MPILEKTLQRIKNNDPTLRNLDLALRGLENREIEELVDALSTNTTITTLDLSMNQSLTVEGLGLLAAALSTNTTIQNFNFNGNEIGDEGAEILATVLLANKSIAELGLTETEIGDEGAEKLANALSTNKTLKTLFLDRNRIGDEGARKLAGALSTNKILTRLFLRGNNEIEVATTNEIKRLTRRNEFILVQFCNKLYNGLLRKDLGLNQQNPIVLFDSESELIAASPRFCFNALDMFLSRKEVYEREAKELFEYIKEFPGGVRMLMSSAELALKNPISPINSLNINHLNISDFFRTKGVVKNLADQALSPFSKITSEDLLREIFQYLEINDIRKAPLDQSPDNNIAEETEEFKEASHVRPEDNLAEKTEELEKTSQVQLLEPAPGTSISTNNETTRLSGCLPPKSCTIS